MWRRKIKVERGHHQAVFNDTRRGDTVRLGGLELFAESTAHHRHCTTRSQDQTDGEEDTLEPIRTHSGKHRGPEGHTRCPHTGQTYLANRFHPNLIVHFLDIPRLGEVSRERERRPHDARGPGTSTGRQEPRTWT